MKLNQKKNKFILIGLFAAMAMTGCSNSDNSDSKANGESTSSPQSIPPQKQEGPAWTLTFQSNCNDDNKTNCIGYYGFSILADGTFQAGPSPQSHVFTGKLPDDSFKNIYSIIYPSLDPSSHHQETAEECMASISTETSDTIVLISGSKKKEIIVSNPNQFCSKGLSSNLAKDIYVALKKYATEHYPIPFPKDSCNEAVAQLEALYSQLGTCSIDEDCTFIDKNYDSIGRESFTFLSVNECSPVKPLMSANKNLVKNQQKNLIQLRDSALDSCKQSTAPVNCTGFSQFQPTLPAPICNAGKCKAEQQFAQPSAFMRRSSEQ